MTWETNRHLITKIKTSITAGIRPCAMIFHEQPTDPWIPFDFKLLEAYQVLQDETCPQCGHPIWLCRSTSSNVTFKVRSATCFSEKALKEFEDSKKPRSDRAKGAERKSWGEHYYTSPYVPPNVEGELPTRSEFYEELAKLR